MVYELISIIVLILIFILLIAWALTKALKNFKIKNSSYKLALKIVAIAFIVSIFYNLFAFFLPSEFSIYIEIFGLILETAVLLYLLNKFYSTTIGKSILILLVTVAYVIIPIIILAIIIGFILGFIKGLLNPNI